MSAPDPWEAVETVFSDGRACADCPHCIRSYAMLDEGRAGDTVRECAMLRTPARYSPADCPGI